MFKKILDEIGEYPQFLGYCLLIVYLLAVILIPPNLTTFNCTRIRSDDFSCTWISSGILGEYQRQFPDGQVESAEVDELPDNLSKLAINTKVGRTYIERFQTNYLSDEIKKKADAINSFIKDDTQKSLSLKEDTRFMYITSPLVLFFGIIFLIGKQY
jgi:hypothetical protein